MYARFFLALVVAAAIGAWMLTGTLVVSGAAEEATPRPPAERQEANDALFKVRVETVTSEERHQDLTMRGRTRANAQVSVAAETAARIVERPVNLGTRVEKGDVLCKLDEGVRSAQLAKAEAEAAKAQLDFEAASKLQGRGFESQTRVAATRASLDAARALIAAAQLELDYTLVRSPISGVVQEPIADVGTVLPIGGLCATVVDNNPIIVTGQVTERDVAKIRHGTPVAVNLVTGEAVDGRVSFISRTGNSETRTFTVEVSISNKDGRLRAGVTAEAHIPLDPITAHRLSPGVLTLSDNGAIGVRSVDDNGIVSFLPVRIAGQDSDGFWVTGLPQTVTIITVGQDYVIEGQKVDPVAVTASGDNA